jgi:hypothetical protein
MIVKLCLVALLQVRAQIERAQALAAKLSDQTTVSGGLTKRQGFSCISLYDIYISHTMHVSCTACCPEHPAHQKQEEPGELQAHQCKQLQ